MGFFTDADKKEEKYNSIIENKNFKTTVFLKIQIIFSMENLTLQMLILKIILFLASKAHQFKRFVEQILKTTIL